jgi:hypothetical protein
LCEKLAVRTLVYVGTLATYLQLKRLTRVFKPPTLGKLWRVLQWKMLVYFIVIWSTYTYYGHFLHFGYLVYFMAIWYILWLFGIFYEYLVYFMNIWYIL